jgi:hypothetical protein
MLRLCLAVRLTPRTRPCKGCSSPGSKGTPVGIAYSVVPTKGNTVPYAPNDLTVLGHRSQIGSGSAVKGHIPVVFAYGAFGRGFSPSLMLSHA